MERGRVTVGGTDRDRKKKGGERENIISYLMPPSTLKSSETIAKQRPLDVDYGNLIPNQT